MFGFRHSGPSRVFSVVSVRHKLILRIVGFPKLNLAYTNQNGNQLWAANKDFTIVLDPLYKRYKLVYIIQICSIDTIRLSGRAKMMQQNILARIIYT